MADPASPPEDQRFRGGEAPKETKIEVAADVRRLIPSSLDRMNEPSHVGCYEGSVFAGAKIDTH